MIKEGLLIGGTVLGLIAGSQEGSKTLLTGDSQESKYVRIFDQIFTEQNIGLVPSLKQKSIEDRIVLIKSGSPDYIGPSSEPFHEIYRLLTGQSEGARKFEHTGNLFSHFDVEPAKYTSARGFHDNSSKEDKTWTIFTKSRIKSNSGWWYLPNNTASPEKEEGCTTKAYLSIFVKPTSEGFRDFSYFLYDFMMKTKESPISAKTVSGYTELMQHFDTLVMYGSESVLKEAIDWANRYDKSENIKILSPEDRFDLYGKVTFGVDLKSVDGDAQSDTNLLSYYITYACLEDQFLDKIKTDINKENAIKSIIKDWAHKTVAEKCFFAEVTLREDFPRIL